MTVRVERYERPDKRRGEAADSLEAEVELEAKVRDTFIARERLPLQAQELVQFRDALRALLESLTGEATLSTLDHQVGVTITLSSGKGNVHAFLHDIHRCGQMRLNGTTDQSYLGESLKELDALLETFPSRARGKLWRR